MEFQNEKLNIDTLEILKDKPWAKHLLNRLQNKLIQTVVNWVEELISLGDNAKDIEEWVQMFEHTYDETGSDIIVGIKAYKAKVAAKIGKHLEEIDRLCETLQIDMPQLGSGKRGLQQEQLHMQSLITEYQQIIKARTNQLNALRTQQLDLCQCLGKEPRILSDSPLPSAEEIKKLQDYVNRLEEERFHRMEEYCTIKQEIIDIINNLKITPTSTFERELIEKDDFKLTTDNMELLRNLHRNLVEQNERVKERIDELWNKILILWNILDVDLLKRKSFRQKYHDYSCSTLEALEKEQARCEPNIKIFIEKLRCELKSLWEKCYCTEEDGKDKCLFWMSECYTEDLLQLYEIEVEKWKHFYEETRKIIQLIKKHKEYWMKVIDFEQKSADPNRFNNRGGQLLKEEKERNTLSKKIPVLEKKLMQMSEKYQSCHGEMMKIYGQTIPEYLDNLHADKENAKKQKLSARKQNNKHLTLTPMKSAMSLFPSMSSLNLATPKQTFNTASNTPNTMRITPKAPATVIPRCEKLTVPKMTVTTTTLSKRLSAERKGRLEKRRSANRKRKQALDSSSLEYREFSGELSKRKECRSTMNLLADTDKCKRTLCPPQTPKRPISCTPSKTKFPRL